MNKRALGYFMVVWAAIVFSLGAETKPAGGGTTKAPFSGMVLDLGDVPGNFTVTTEYSNAVLKAVLPYFSDVAERLNLPGPHQID